MWIRRIKMTLLVLFLCFSSLAGAAEEEHAVEAKRAAFLHDADLIREKLETTADFSKRTEIFFKYRDAIRSIEQNLGEVTTMEERYYQFAVETFDIAFERLKQDKFTYEKCKEALDAIPGRFNPRARNENDVSIDARKAYYVVRALCAGSQPVNAGFAPQ